MYLFNKFWSPNIPVTILGYRTPPFKLYPNFNFISLASKQESANEWAKHHYDFFDSLNDDHFIWTVEDSYLLRPVNVNIVSSLKAFITDPTVGRISLINPIEEHPTSVIKSENDYDIIEATQDADSRIAVVWTIWNRQYALRHLVEGWSPWDVELKGSQLAKNDDWRIIGSQNKHAIDYASPHRKPGRGLPHGILDFRYTNKPHLMLDHQSLYELMSLGMINEHLQLIKS